MSKLKLMTIVGTRPEIIRLAAVIKKCDKYFDQILVHTGQNYDYSLNQVFFEDLGLREPDFYLNAVGNDLGETIGNIIAKSYQLMVAEKPDALLILGDTNSCLSAISAKLNFYFSFVLSAVICMYTSGSLVCFFLFFFLDIFLSSIKLLFFADDWLLLWCNTST